jgi:hypothetical protein
VLLFCGHNFTALLYLNFKVIMSNKRQRAKISLSSEPVKKEWFIYYTPHPTKHNGYVCKFCPSGSKIYSQVKGAGCGNLVKHMKSQHSADIIP